MGAKAHAFIGNSSQFGETEDLIAAGIRENDAGPGHELVQATKLAHEFMARPQIKMISICEEDLCAEFFKRFLSEPFNGGLRSHRQEEGRLHSAVRRGHAAATRPGGVGFQHFESKTHPLSVSGEDEGPAHAAHHVNGPHSESNRQGLRALQLFGIYRGKSDGQEDQCPEHKNVNGFAKGKQPFCCVVRKDGSEIGSKRIVQVGCAIGLQVKNEDEERATDKAGQKGVGSDAEGRAEICADPTQETVSAPHDESHDKGRENWTKRAEHIGRDGREFGAGFDLPLFLFRRKLGRPRTLFDLLVHEIAPVNALIDGDADQQAESCRESDREQPTGLSDDVFKLSLIHI